MSEPVRFIRKNGKVIPIAAGRAGSVGVAAVKTGAAVAVHKFTRSNAKSGGSSGSKKAPFKVNQALNLTGLGLSIGTGILGAATFAGGAKQFIGGSVATHAIDAAGIGINAASVAGKGHTKERVRQGARQEARNLIVGNGIYLAGIVGIKKNRKALAGAAQKIVALGRKVLRVA